METPEAISVTSKEEAKQKKSILKKVKSVVDLFKLKKKYLCQRCDYASDYSANVKKHAEVIHEGFKRFGCDQCEYRCSDRNKIEQHKAAIHGNERNVSCDRCDLKFKTRLNLRVHIKVVHERHRLAKCKQCDFTALASCNVRKHTRVVHERLLSLACDVVDCDYRTDEQRSLRSHFLTKHLKRKLDKQHQCPRCDYSVDSKRILQDHVDFKHDKNFKYVCDICNCPKVSQETLESHKKNVHEGIKDFVCDIVDCEYRTGYKEELTIHVQAKHLNMKRHKCDSCDFRTYRQQGLKRHFFTEHLKRKFDKQHQCPRCDFSANTGNKLQDHVDFRHEKNFKYICDICNCPSASQRNLAIHKKMVHEGIKEFQCDVVDCKYKVVFKYQLKKHFRVKHLNMKLDTNKCDSCDYTANRKKSLQDHVDFKHEKNFKYVCDICNCPLLTQRNLESHKKSVHEGIKDFACDVVDCEFKTAYKPTLKIHAQAKHLNMKHDTNKCDRCDYSATTKKALQDHVDFIHEINFKYVCDICKLPQPSQSKLESHKKRLHIPRKCGSCDYSSTNKKALQDHMHFNHNTNFKYVCDICKVPQPSQQKLRYHKKVARCGLTKLKCDHCVSFTTNKKKDLEDHMSLAHLDVIEGQCSQCNYRARSKKRMILHVSAHKRQESKKRDSKVNKPLQKHNCDKCDKIKFSAVTKNELQDHVDLVHDKRYRCLVNVNNIVSLLCSLCPFKTGEKDQMRLHQRSYHKTIDGKDENNNYNLVKNEKKLVLEEEEVTFSIKVKEEEIG